MLPFSTRLDSWYSPSQPAMFNSLRSRLFLSYLLVVASSTLIIGLTLLVVLRANPGIERLDYARLSELLRAGVRADPPPATGELAELNVYALRFAADNDVRVIFTERGGGVTVDSAVLAGQAAPDDIVRIETLTGSVDRDRGLVRDSSKRTWLFLYASASLSSGARMVLLTQPTGPLRFLLTNFLSPLVESTCVGIGLSIVLSVLITYWLTGSLRKFSTAARAVAQGELDHTVPVDGPAEVRSLAQSFNEMIARVRGGQQAQRDFVANVSHELKTPLTSIQGFSQAILDGATNDVPHAAHIINDEAGRMRRLVDGLLDLARLDAGQAALQRVPTDLAAILRSVAEKLSLRAGQNNVALRVDIQPLPVIVADGDRLAQVFTNLLDNALKHTPDGGSIALAAKPDGGTVTVSVTDTGVGIPAEDLPRIFERFYRVDKSRTAGHGYGIGLAITSEIIRAHGGTIAAESVLGLGTKFTVKLPVARSGDTTVARRRT